MKPWELAAQPAVWMYRALDAEAAEKSAEAASRGKPRQEMPGRARKR